MTGIIDYIRTTRLIYSKRLSSLPKEKRTDESKLDKFPQMMEGLTPQVQYIDKQKEYLQEMTRLQKEKNNNKE